MKGAAAVAIEATQIGGGRTLRSGFDELGLRLRDRDAFYAGAACAVELYDAARDLKTPLSMEVEMIEALRAEIQAYAEAAS